ncbi:MAG: metallophosphoesterase [Epsilonproteobacteria bacterium]|nr:metallophosphoesterase [Campylobacterota bacterium]
MQRGMHYVIGDVHGEYQMLLALVDKLPTDAKLIFVGDLVNRGKQSREVIKFARENAFAVVRGNHEEYMLEHGRNFIEGIEKDKRVNLHNMWMYVGGVQMLQSYRVLSKASDEPKVLKNEEGIASLKRDLEWIASLPLFIDMGEIENYHLPLVISHGSIGDFWHLKETNRKHFEFYILSNRRRPSSNSPIFNIYGHTVVPSVVKGKNFVSLDTGCGKSHDAKLSAYCIESGEVFEVSKAEFSEEEKV